MIHRLFRTELTPERQRVLAATSQELQSRERYRHRLDLDPAAGGALGARLPVSANLELTEACQLRCAMCPRTVRGGDPARTMAVAELELVLGRLAAAGIDRIALQFLGEPLLHPAFPRCLELTRAAAAVVGFTTNGLLLAGANADAALRWADRVSVSLDGAAPAGYRRVRAGSDLETVERNLRAFVAARDRSGRALPLIVVRTTMVPGALPDRATVSRWTALADVLELRYCLPADPPPLADAELDLVPCTLAFRNLTVRADLRAQPCCADFGGELALGSLRDAAVADLWEGDAAWRLRKSLLDRSTLPAPCRRCRILSERFHREWDGLLAPLGLAGAGAVPAEL